jgi:transketolase
MRGAFLKTLADLAGSDDRIVLLTGDLGFTVVEPFAERFPKRFFNVGVAEQNMVGVATGLAEAGFIPFVYSIGTFATLRAYEFIRNGPVLHQLPVRIVGIGGGFEYGSAGFTHHALEDLAVMRVLPGLTVVAPADPAQAAAALNAIWNHPGPIYFRLGKDDRATVPGLDGSFELGRIERLRDGRDVAIVTTGAIASEALAAADALQEAGIESTVLIVATISPAPTEGLAQMLDDFRTIVTVEAHYQIGGLGSLVCEVMAERSPGAHVIRLGVSGSPGGVSGSEGFLNRAHGLSRELIAARIRSLLDVPA